MRPGVAKTYLDEVAADFEKYAREHYVSALCASDPDPVDRVAGARFVASRRVEGVESCLRDVLGTRSRDRLRNELDAACVDALITTAPDRLATTRFLALVASDRRTGGASSRLFLETFERLGAVGNEALLQELAVPWYDEARLRKLTRLLIRSSGVQPPEPVSALVRLESAGRQALVEQWREAIRAAGGLEEEKADG